MDAKDLPNLVVDYLYDELDPEQRAAFEAALPDAPEVRAEVEAFQRTREAFADLSELEVPSGISNKLMAEAARVAPAPQRKSLLERIRAALSLMVLHPAMSAAVVMVAVLGVSLYVYRHGAPPRRLPKADSPALPAARPVADKVAASEAKAQRVDEAVRQGKPAAKAALADQKQRAAAPQQAGSAAVGDLEGASKRARRGKLAGGSLSRGSAGAKNEGFFKRLGGKSGKGDSMSNVTTDRRERAAARALAKRDKLAETDDDRLASKRKRARRAPAKPVARPAPNKKALSFSRPAPKSPKPKPKQRRATPRKAKKGKKDDAQRNTEQPAAARRWLQLGASAVASKRCPEAFDYFTRALKATPSLLAQVSAQLGSCRSALRRAGSAHAWLRGRIHGQERRPARRKARRRKTVDQRVQETK